MSKPPYDRWWVVKIRTARKKSVEQSIRADTEADARVLACPGRGDTIEKVTACTEFNCKVTGWQHRTINKSDTFEALGDCASLLRVGVPFQEALKLQLPKIKSPTLRYELYMVAQSLITQGVGVPEAFGQRRKICDDNLESIIRVGFESGSMAQSFQDMRDKTRKDRRFNAKIRGSLMQPAITVIFLMVLTIFFSLFIIPKVGGIYEQFKAPLPAISRPTFFMAGIMKKYAFIAIPLFFSIPVILFMKRAAIGRNEKLVQLIYKAPLVGDFFSMVDLIDAVRNLSILLRTGVPLNDSLKLTAAGLKNPRTRRAWIAINEEISERGSDASAAFEKYSDDLGSEGATLATIVRIGEQGANLSTLLTDKAVDYTAEVDERSEDVIKLIGPVVNIVIFSIAGFLLMTTYMPILQLNSLVTGMKPTSTQTH